MDAGEAMDDVYLRYGGRRGLVIGDDDDDDDDDHEFDNCEDGHIMDTHRRHRHRRGEENYRGDYDNDIDDASRYRRVGGEDPVRHTTGAAGIYGRSCSSYLGAATDSDTDDGFDTDDDEDQWRAAGGRIGGRFFPHRWHPRHGPPPPTPQDEARAARRAREARLRMLRRRASASGAESAALTLERDASRYVEPTLAWMLKAKPTFREFRPNPNHPFPRRHIQHRRFERMVGDRWWADDAWRREEREEILSAAAAAAGRTRATLVERRQRIRGFEDLDDDM
jgi:hypothetical protein